MKNNWTLTIGGVLFFMFFLTVIIFNSSDAPVRAPASVANDYHHMEMMIPSETLTNRELNY